MARRTTKRAEQVIERREAILAAAIRIFAEQGLAGARTEAIVKEAGVNKALLYYYFKSKAKLFEAVIEDHFSEFNRQSMELLASSGSAQEILLQYVSLHFDFMSSHHRYAPLHHQLMNGEQQFEEIVRRYILPRGRALGALLERGMKEGEFRRADIQHTAISITALIIFYFSASRVLKVFGNPDAYSETNLKHRKQEVIDFIRHGLFIEPKVPNHETT